jgi:transcriptional regulator with XRE-family HTH domain
MKLHAATLCVEEIGSAEIRKSLRTQREALQLSQLALAKRSGVPASNINRIEEGKQEITPRTFARLMTAMEERAKELHAEIEELRGIQAARQRVAICKALPFLRQRLPQAQAELAKLENETQNKKTRMSELESPVVRGLLESHERENAQLKKEYAEMVDIFEQIGGICMLRAIKSYIEGDETIRSAYERWEKTGQTDLRVKLDKVELVEENER